MGDTVYWAELQGALSDVGLNVALDVPIPNGPWVGQIDGRPFTMTVTPKSDEDGLRDFMIVSLFRQEEEKVIPLLSQFMGYQSFCRYLHRKNAEASATYEWDRKEPAARFKELEKDVDVYELKRLEKGFAAPSAKGMDDFFQQITPQIIEKWEAAVRDDPKAEWNCNRLCDILPFVKAVMPRVGRNQSLFGLSIISLDGKTQNEKEIVRYGLAPLLAARILTEDEAVQVVDWYLQTSPTWDSGGAGQFTKDFTLGGVSYRLITDAYRDCRDLNLQVLKAS